MQNRAADARHTEQIEAHGLKAVRLSACGSEAVVYLQGAHVASFRTSEHGELLWLSEKASYGAGKAIRGGVPICFPWFGPHPTRSELPAHGFARTSLFRFEGSEMHGDNVVATFSLDGSPQSQPLFAFDFVARLQVQVGRELSLKLEVENTGSCAFDYELLLHSYLSVSDVRCVEIEGLEGASYLDKVTGERDCRQPPGALRLTGETDRVYDSSARVSVLDPARKRRLIVDKTRSSSTVVWNPWLEKARRMSDFGEEQWPGMLCIEAGNVSPHAVRLAPETRHAMTTIISAETVASASP